MDNIYPRLREEMEENFYRATVPAELTARGFHVCVKEEDVVEHERVLAAR